MAAFEAGDYTLLSDEAKEKISPEMFAEKLADYAEKEDTEYRKKSEKRGSGKHFKHNHAEAVERIIATVDTNKLERALNKINGKIDRVEDEVVLDLLEGIREIIEEKLA